MMALWWIGNLVFLAVIIPVVLYLLTRLLQPAMEIRQYADDALEHGSGLLEELDGVEELTRTRDLVRDIGNGMRRYRAALEQLL